MPDLFLLIVATCQAALTTLVLARSSILRPLRVWLAQGKGLRGFLGELLGCTFCTSIWTSTLWTLAYFLYEDGCWCWYSVGIAWPIVAVGQAPIAWFVYAAHKHMPNKDGAVSR